MSLIGIRHICAVRAVGVCLVWMALAIATLAQGVSTTTVQGTVYQANGTPGSGTLQINWPAFTTASNQTVAAGKITASIGADGFVSVNLAPNLGSSPAGLYYTVVYHLGDGTTSTEYRRRESSELLGVLRSADLQHAIGRLIVINSQSSVIADAAWLALN